MKRTLGLLWTGGFAFFFSFYILLSTLPLYIRELGASDRAIGLVIGVFAFASMIVKPAAGWSSDRFGRKPLLLLGPVIFVAASLGYHFSTTVVALLALRLFHGAGMGLFPTAASAVVADLAPPDRRGEYLGFFDAAANIAMAVGPLAGVAVTERAGFAGLFATAVGSAVVALVMVIAVPETLGERRQLPLRIEAALSRAALFPSSMVLLIMLTYGVHVSFLPIFAQSQGVNPGLFYLVFALVAAGVRGHAGRLSDRLGRAPVTAAGLALAAAALLTLAFTRGTLALAGAGALYGIGFGTAQPSLMAWCVDRVGPRDRGRAMGTYYTTLELGIAAGAMSAGVLIGAAGFTVTFVIAALVAAAGAGIALAAAVAPLAATPERTR